MAIDSTAKKASLINFALPFLILGPILDGVFGTAEQQHLLHLYTGIAADPPASAALAVIRAYVYAGPQELQVYAGPQRLSVHAGAPSGQVWIGDET